MRSDTSENQTYEEQLLQSGFNPYEAEQAASIISSLSQQELELLCEVWPDWAATYLGKEALN